MELRGKWEHQEKMDCRVHEDVRDLLVPPGLLLLLRYVRTRTRLTWSGTDWQNMFCDPWDSTEESKNPDHLHRHL